MLIGLKTRTTISLPIRRSNSGLKFLLHKIAQHMKWLHNRLAFPSISKQNFGTKKKLLAHIDYSRTLEGLALFVNRDFARKFYLPFSVKEVRRAWHCKQGRLQDRLTDDMIDLRFCRVVIPEGGRTRPGANRRRR